METYLLKMFLLSSIFIGFYYLILERQKQHQFKRFYLLFSILFSMLIPLISITYGVEKQVSENLIFIENQGEIKGQIIEVQSVFATENVIYGVYVLVTVMLFFKFLISLNALRKEIRYGKKVKSGNYTLVLKENKTPAHSFWKYIFLNRFDYEQGKIDDKIIRHEELHLEQRHSLDLLFIELILVLFWFNPAFYFYKKAMLINHEFLADEHVLKYDGNIKSYQQLLLTELISERILFTNQFNLSNTKKRIKMMTTPNNKKSKFYSWLTLPLAAGLFFVFVEKVPAQKEENSSKNVKVGHEVPQAKIKNFEKELKKSVENGPILIAKKDTLKPKKSTERSIPPPPPPKEEMVSEKSAVSENAPPSESPKERNITTSLISPPMTKSQMAELQKKDIAEDQAQFPGGLGVFRGKIMGEFNNAKLIDKKGTLQNEIFFIVDKNGKAKDFRVVGNDGVFNQESLRAVRKVAESETWKPSTKDGVPTDFIFKLPLTMTFQ